MVLWEVEFGFRFCREERGVFEVSEFIVRLQSFSYLLDNFFCFVIMENRVCLFKRSIQEIFYSCVIEDRKSVLFIFSFLWLVSC